MSEQIELTSELRLDLIEHHGSDLTIIKAARVSTQTEPKEDDEKLLKFLMRNKHASPWEHPHITCLVDAPIFVAREHMRHRVQAFNEVSGRYSVLKPRFYAPDEDRGLIQSGKPGQYKFTQGSEDQMMKLHSEIRFSCQQSWDTYTRLLESGVAKEIARMVLPVNIYSAWYASATLRGWLNFLALRTDETAMYEIRQIAGYVETELHKLFPLTLNAWDESGRNSL